MIVILSGDSVFSKMLQYELEAQFHNEVVPVEPAGDADALYRAELAIVDMDMPKNRPEQILQIAAENHLCVIGFGYTKADALPDSFAQQCAEIFHRPFSVPRFLDVVARCLPERASASIPDAPIDKISALKPNRSKRCVYYQNTEILLSGREFDVFFHLLQNRGKSVSRAELHEAVWGSPLAPNDNIVDVNIKNIRKKAEPILKTKIIYSVRGIGYTIPNGTQGGISC